MKINFLKIFKKFFSILKPFSDKIPGWGIMWENKKNSHGLLLIAHWDIRTDLPLG